MSQVYDLTPDSFKGLCSQLRKAKTTPQSHKDLHVSDSQLAEMKAAFNAACTYFNSVITALQPQNGKFTINDAGIAGTLALVLQQWGDGSADLQKVIDALSDSGGGSDGPAIQHP